MKPTVKRAILLLLTDGKSPTAFSNIYIDNDIHVTDRTTGEIHVSPKNVKDLEKEIEKVTKLFNSKLYKVLK